jgi:hypothetical protein
MNGPSFFHDVKNVTVTPAGGPAVAVFACTGIKLSRASGRIYGFDNNNPRAVASHVVRINDKVSIMTEDVNAMTALYAITVPCVITFDWEPDSQNTSTTTLAAQLVTITNFVINSSGVDIGMQKHSTNSIDGELLGVEAGTDPVSFATGS